MDVSDAQFSDITDNNCNIVIVILIMIMCTQITINKALLLCHAINASYHIVQVNQYLLILLYYHQ